MSTASKWADYLAIMTAARTAAAARGAALIDTQDLFIALTLDAGTTGAALRNLGVTEEKAQRALASLESSLLATLGMQEVPARQPLPHLSGFNFTDRSQKLLQQTLTPQALALALLTEPTGVITEALERCGVRPEQVRETLTLNAEGASNSAAEEQAGASSADGTRLGASRQIFIPAPAESIWNLIKDPTQLASWVPSLEQVEPHPTDGVWLGSTTDLDQTKKFGRVQNEALTRSIRQTQLSHTPADYRVTYELGFPQQPRFNTQLIEVTLLPQDSGALAQVTSSWLRAPEANLPRSLRLLRRPLGAAMRPITRWTTTIQASTLAEQLRAAATA
ncbi:MAG TPA: SRPBCC family protein [Candidatus Rothia avicola]|uniref:SRPBCC family protein n=1 Tax=Candidatus Rothia avicola TaxID=2840478 RepID=A0A9D2CQ90_9MICC|nr:SRPBCC family protein [Candidatus Rothia avicola]